MGILSGRGAARRKQRTAFDEEALPHLDSLYRYARHLTRHDRDAEDLVQDTMVKAYRFFHRYQPGTNCRAWLFRIMTNSFLKQKSKKVREFSFIENIDSFEGDGGPGLDDRAGSFMNPEKELLGHMVHDRVKDAIAELSPDFRTVVLLADLQDFTYKEIAEVMDCPVGTVMSRLYRARKALQKKLLDYAVDEGYVDGMPKPRRRGRGASNDARDESAQQAQDETPTSLTEWRARKNGTNGEA